jgi:hypothetical protein
MEIISYEDVKKGDVLVWVLRETVHDFEDGESHRYMAGVIGVVERLSNRESFAGEASMFIDFTWCETDGDWWNGPGRAVSDIWYVVVDVLVRCVDVAEARDALNRVKLLGDV